MVDAAALANARLRKVGPPKQRIEPSLAAEKKELEYAQRKIREADLEAWYSKMSHLTYPTAFLPLSIPDAKEIIAHHKELKNGSVLEVSSSLAKLCALLEDDIEKFGSAGVFAKLSSRSPKDAAGEQCHAIYRQLVLSEKQRLGRAPTLNWKLSALNRAHIECMKACSGNYLSSERIDEDLRLGLDNPATFAQNVILRKWMPIPIEFEFRGFVRNRKLNALSQYYVICFFPHLVEMRATIATRIQKFFEAEVLPVFPFQDMIVDFAYDKDTDRVYILELNPYGPGTNAALFDWQKDLSIIENGPFCFRLEEQERADLKAWCSPTFWALLSED